MEAQDADRRQLGLRRELVAAQLRDLEAQAERFAPRLLPHQLAQKLRQIRDELARLDAELARLEQP
jgi:hypothetical protein